MVEMIQRIFRSFEHNNLSALYPPPEGTGFTARVIKRESDGLALKQGVRIQFREHLPKNGVEHNRQVFCFDFSDV